MTDVELDLTSELLPGIDEYYLCRWCGLVARNTDWTSTTWCGGYHFACPICGYRYEPWQTKVGMSKASKIIVMESPEEGFIRPDRTLQEKGVVFVPVLWADTTTAVLQMRFKEIMLDMEKNLDGLTPKERVAEVTQQVMAKGTRTYFQRMAVTDAAKARINTYTKDKYRYEEQETAGIEAMILPADVRMEEPLSQTDALAMYGMTKWLTSNSSSQM